MTEPKNVHMTTMMAFLAVEITQIIGDIIFPNFPVPKHFLNKFWRQLPGSSSEVPIQFAFFKA